VVRKRYRDAIQRKIAGREITATPESPRAQIVDLMEALKASLAAKRAASEKAASSSAAGTATGTEG